MIHKNILIACAIIILVGVVFVGYRAERPLDATPQNVTLSGTYVCLPHLNPGDVVTQECRFGLQTDDGVYYAVDFGQVGNETELFQSGERITAEGFVVIKEALSTNEWAPYNMKGIFSITNIVSPAPVGGKLDINVVCESALAYMTFTDAASAEVFLRECREGKHPEVIEQYIQQMGLGDGAVI